MPQGDSVSPERHRTFLGRLIVPLLPHAAGERVVAIANLSERGVRCSLNKCLLNTRGGGIGRFPGLRVSYLLLGVCLS